MKRLALVFILILAGARAQGEGLPVAPGLWQAESRVEAYRLADGTRSPLPEVTTSHSRCIGADRPEISVRDLAGAGCDASEISRKDGSISFVLACRRQGADFYGSMSAERLDSGNRARTHMELSGRRPDGSEIKIIAESTAQRTGACE